MEKMTNMLRLDDKSGFTDESAHDNFKCDECRSEFHKPLLARVASHGGVQVYYACPRCLTKVNDVEEHRSKERSAPSFSVESVKAPSVVKSGSSGGKCGHFVGYLKQRGRDNPIPDECLTCDKMIECMVR